MCNFVANIDILGYGMIFDIIAKLRPKRKRI